MSKCLHEVVSNLHSLLYSIVRAKAMEQVVRTLHFAKPFEKSLCF